MALCDGLRQAAQVPAQQLRTAFYSDEDRRRLGRAVKRARRAAGFTSQKAMAEATDGLVGVRSISAVETGEPLVGERVLEDIGRFLGQYFIDWNEDAPRKILEGEPAPALTRVQAAPSAPPDEGVTWERYRREMKYFYWRFRETPEDYKRLRDLLVLSAQLDFPESDPTESGLEETTPG